MDKTATTNQEISLQLDNQFLLRVAQTLNIGVAIVELESWEVIFENANFFKWFPPESDADELLGERIPRLKTDRVQKRIEAGRVFTSEVESLSGERATPIAVEIRSLGNQYDKLMVVECHNLTKQRQSEYMLEFCLKQS